MRRERFVEELESYSKQLEEFQTFGDMQEIQRYFKKAQALNQRLESAADKVWSLLHSTAEPLHADTLLFQSPHYYRLYCIVPEKMSFIFNYNSGIY